MSEAVDLTNCDREPIQIPGSIQAHGTLIVCDPGAVTVLRHAANFADMLGLAAGEINGKPLDALLGETATHEIRNALARSNDPARPGLVMNLPLGAGAARFDVAVHHYQGNVIVEIEPTPSESRSPPLEITRALTGRLGKIGDLDELVTVAARLVRSLLGYDRVMIYRFAADGSGQVVAEAKRSDLESFMGQHFPAGDIPQQARQLYVKNTIRLISDIDDERVAIVPAIDASGLPIDLSFAHLRSVSPIHIEYLRNMGVGASMSVSVIVGGRLWGLIACHHYAPRVLSLAQRVATEMFGEFFALHLDALSNRRVIETAARARHALDRLLRSASQEADIRTLLQTSLADLTLLMPCDGIGLWMDGAWAGLDVTPPDEAIPLLAEFMNQTAQGQIWSTEALCDALPAAADYCAKVSGVLAVPLSQLPRDYLFYFRREVIQTVEWAGNPEKKYATGPLGDRLTPRKSFAIWKQTVERQSKPWTADDREIAEAARAALVETVLRHSELLADERSKAALRQKMLNEELNHRVKNILALIKSLVSHPGDSAHTLEDYVRSLKGRIQALAFAHDQVIRGDGGSSLHDLLRAELSPYYDSAAAIVLDGPPVALDARAFSVMALVLHELATNAAKYGALSGAGGRLEVTWTFHERAGCEIKWRESGGPAVQPPTRQGFGSVLVSRSVPFDLGGESDVEYAPTGVSARFALPARFVQRLERERGARTVEAPGVEAPGQLNGLKLLLVEDQMLIALDVEAMLIANGASMIEAAPSASEGLQKLSAFDPDAAVLDVNLGVGTSIPVAEELARRCIPFVFATGYGDSMAIPKLFSTRPVVRKPYDAGALTAALIKAITDHASAPMAVAADPPT